MIVCTHDFIYLERIEEDQVQGTCLVCRKSMEMTPNEMERHFIPFESTAAPSWDAHLRRAERDVILVRKKKLNG